MDKITFEDLPSETTPVRASKLNEMQANIEKSTVYVGSTAPSTTEKTWFKCGKNLFNKDKIQRGYLKGDGGIETTEATHNEMTSELIPIESSKPYTFNVTDYIVPSGEQMWVAIGLYSDDKTFINRYAEYNINVISVTANQASNAKYIRVSYRYNSSSIKCQLEQNSSATTYEAYVNKEILVKNSNGNFENFYDENKLETKAMSSLQVGASSSNLISVKSASYVELPNLSQTINVQKDNSTIFVYLTVGGLYNDNSGYAVGFNIQMDDATYSSSGNKVTGAGDWRANWASDGTSKVTFSNIFIFQNVSKGQHTFKPMWTSSDASVTAYTGYYSLRSMTVVEL